MNTVKHTKKQIAEGYARFMEEHSDNDELGDITLKVFTELLESGYYFFIAFC